MTAYADTSAYVSLFTEPGKAQIEYTREAQHGRHFPGWCVMTSCRPPLKRRGALGFVARFLQPLRMRELFVVIRREVNGRPFAPGVGDRQHFAGNRVTPLAYLGTAHGTLKIGRVHAYSLRRWTAYNDERGTHRDTWIPETARHARSYLAKPSITSPERLT